jgi:hypothetical protein
MREGNMAISDMEAANEFGRGPDGRQRPRRCRTGCTWVRPKPDVIRYQSNPFDFEPAALDGLDLGRAGIATVLWATG